MLKSDLKVHLGSPDLFPRVLIFKKELSFLSPEPHPNPAPLPPEQIEGENPGSEGEVGVGGRTTVVLEPPWGEEPRGSGLAWGWGEPQIPQNRKCSVST